MPKEPHTSLAGDKKNAEGTLTLVKSGRLSSSQEVVRCPCLARCGVRLRPATKVMREKKRSEERSGAPRVGKFVPVSDPSKACCQVELLRAPAVELQCLPLLKAV